MGIYYAAIDFEAKEKIEPPDGEANKTPGLYYPGNSFSGMVVMKNTQGSAFEIVDDMSGTELFYSNDYKNITKAVFKEYKEKFAGYFADDD